jgi:hypothetical protein
MTPTMKPAKPAVEYRFNGTADAFECPLCQTSFRTVPGTWPYVAGTNKPVCGGADCPVGEDAPHASPCNTIFEFCELAPATLEAIRTTSGADSVPERLRHAGLDESLPLQDRDVLSRAAIDLLYWEADSTCIAATEPRLVLRTCPEAAAEMLLSGCGDIVE